MKFIISTFFVLFFSVHLFSQNFEPGIKNNYEIFSDLAIKSFEKIENNFYLQVKGKVFCVKFDKESESSKFLFEKLRSKFQDYKIVTKDALKDSDFLINISELNIKAKYEKYSGSYSVNKKIQRNLEMEYYYKFYGNKEDTLLYKYEAKEKYSDSFNIDFRDEIERSNYEFTKTELPEQSLIQKLFLPCLIIAASAITIVLFFITRSK